MEKLQERAVECAKRYLVNRGYEVLETSYVSPAGQTADVIAHDEGALVFVSVAAREGAEAGFPDENLVAERKHMEVVAAQWLAEHADEANIRVRFDVLGLMVITPDRALIRHHINALGSDFNIDTPEG